MSGRSRAPGSALALAGALAAGLLAPGCRTLHEDGTVCPEYRDLRCLTAVECSMDRGRGCEVCECQRLPTSGEVPSGVPPDQKPE